MEKLLGELNAIGAETEDAIERFSNDKEMYLKCVCDFPDEPSMKDLIKAIKGKDYVQAEKSVHALKGIVSNLGFIPLADAAIDMLAELRDSNIEEALEAYEDVKKEYDKFCTVIKRSLPDEETR